MDAGYIPLVLRQGPSLEFSALGILTSVPQGWGAGMPPCPWALCVGSELRSSCW